MSILYRGLLFFIVIFQVTFVSYISIFGAIPNLALIFLLFLVIFKEYREALVDAFLAGLFIDLFSSLPFGITIISLLATVSAINFLSRNIFSKPNVIIVGIIGALGTLIYKFILIGEIKFFDFFHFSGISYNFLPSLWGEVFYNAILLIGVYLLFRKFSKN